MVMQTAVVADGGNYFPARTVNCNKLFKVIKSLGGNL